MTLPNVRKYEDCRLIVASTANHKPRFTERELYRRGWASGVLPPVIAALAQGRLIAVIFFRLVLVFSARFPASCCGSSEEDECEDDHGCHCWQFSA